MKRKVLFVSLILTLILSAFLFVSCKTGDSARVTFLVDGKAYKVETFERDGELNLPAPEKEGYDFGGWYLDEGTWSQPFSTNFLAGEGASEISVYALYTEHVHNYTEAVRDATCTEGGYTVSICTCGQNIISNETEPLDHGFLTYVSNGDGTATATCFREGCSATDTIAGDGTSGEVAPNRITLSASEKTLELFDSFMLSATHVDGDKEFTFVTTNAQVATVTSDGLVTATGIGNATIKVITDDAVANCEVTVAFLSEKPSVSIVGISSLTDTINVEDDDTFALSIRIFYKGQYYFNAEAEYVLSNASIGRIENSVFIPNRVTGAGAEATLTAKASWMGYDSLELPTLATTIKILVKPGEADTTSYISVNGTVPHDVDTIYLFAIAGDPLHPKTYDFVLRRVNNGVTNSTFSGLTVTTNTSIVRVNGETIEAVGAGTTDVVVSLSGYTGAHIEGLTRFSVRVEVRYVIQDKSSEYDVGLVSAKDGYNLSDIQNFFGSGTENKIIKAYEDIYGDNEVELTVSNGVVKGFSTERSSLKTTAVTFLTAGYGYTFNVDVCSDIITTADEFKSAFTLQTTYIQNYAGTLVSVKRAYGYYVLGANINVTGTWSNTPASQYGTGNYGWQQAESGFFGYFDGQGHTITFNKLSNGGVFGKIGDGTTIKNLDICVKGMAATTENTNVILATTIGFYGVGPQNDAGGWKDREIQDTFITNVSIRVTPSSTAKINGFDGITAVNCSAYLTDIYVYLNENVTVKKSSSSSDQYGLLISANKGNVSAIKNSLENCCNNVVVVSATKELCSTTTTDNLATVDTVNQTRQFYFYASDDQSYLASQSWYISYNNSLDASSTNKDISRFTVTKVKRYDTVALMRSAGATQVGSWQISSSGAVTYA